MNIMPIEYEPSLRRMFIAELPEEFNIQAWQINQVVMPEFINCGCYFKEGSWTELEIRFIDIVDFSAYINLLKNKKKRSFNIIVKEIDKTGKILNAFTIKIKYILSIERDSYLYEADDCLHTVARFKVKTVIPQ